ncbi:hypothetical protein KDA_40280 [Dictyobacter alpinus]|uniref:Uncharacterized protein n=1 Tax=Dictyobacter alpinus TaxID=2014873 RepID=A0A402BB27_9CHLR|nr:hypothetical protein KDA_40280 [Dictyobacter alpinus]
MQIEYLLKVKEYFFKRKFQDPIWIDNDDRKYEPIDKPVRVYEQALFYSSFISTSIVRLVALYFRWSFITWLALFFIAACSILSLIYLLFPPRLSLTRLCYIFVCSILCLVVYNQ